MVRIKVCGITRHKDAQKAVELGAFAVGFVFYKNSPRYISPQEAKRIIEKLPPFVASVGIFVNEKEENVSRIAAYCGLTTLQFHGDESPSYCLRFKRYKVIKAIRVKDGASLGRMKKFTVDAILLDTFQGDAYGGTGITFDWNIIAKHKTGSVPIILSGGLNDKNVKRAIRKVHPFAVDVSSGIEAAPGEKSEKLMKQFFKAAGLI